MKKFPTYIQRDVMDCGPSCLKIISEYYGRNFSIDKLRQLASTGKLGSTFLGLSNAAEALGFRTMAVKISFNRLRKEADLPVIVHWNQVHYVVVYAISNTKVYVSDPGYGLDSYSHEAFIKNWIGGNSTQDTIDGIVLLFELTPGFFETKELEDKSTAQKDLRFLLHYIRPHRKYLLQVFVGLICGSLLTIIFPFLTQSLIDIGIGDKNIRFVWLIMIAQLTISFSQTLLDIIRSWLMLHVNKRMSIRLISDFFAKIMKLPISFFDTKLTGDIMQRIGDHSRIQSFLTGTSLSTIFSMFTAIVYSWLLIYYSITLFLVSLVGSIIYLLWITFFLKRRKKLDYKRFGHSSELNSKVFELVSGMQELKLHNAEQNKRWQWEHIQLKLYQISIESLSLEQMQGIGSRVINNVKNIIITVISAKLVIDGNLTLGMMVAVTFIIGQLNRPLVDLINLVRKWQDTKISLSRINEIHLKKDEIEYAISSNDEMPISDIPKEISITLKDVSFKYNNMSTNVLANINLVIPYNKVTAIVGTSGGGKSTFVKLLMGSYMPTSGEILINDKINLRKINLKEWRNTFGVVMQEGFLFNDSFLGNIAVGEDLPNLDKVINAAKIANIHSHIMTTPREYRTKIGNEGVPISTGEKQRVLIARAIYKNPDILFLDEATSSLDANNEKDIMEKLNDFYSNKTVVVIAHRLSTIKNADNIVVLDKGEIVEQGSHNELIKQGGYYFRLVDKQL